MSWMLWVFWLLVLLSLVALAATIRSDIRAREMGDVLDKDLGPKPCERCNDLR